MKERLFKTTITLTCVLILSGCSLKEGAANVFSNIVGKETPAQESKAGTKKEETKEPLDVYSDVVTDTFDQSNDMLVRFNNTLDMLYAGEASEEQFALILQDIIPQSNKMIAKLDTVLYDIDTPLYDFHRKLITLVNFQHEMFLKSLESANSPEIEIDKDAIRADYVKIKGEQTVLVQEVKEIFAALMEAEQTSKEEEKKQ